MLIKNEKYFYFPLNNKYLYITVFIDFNFEFNMLLLYITINYFEYFIASFN